MGDSHTGQSAGWANHARLKWQNSFFSWLSSSLTQMGTFEMEWQYLTRLIMCANSFPSVTENFDHGLEIKLVCVLLILLLFWVQLHKKYLYILRNESQQSTVLHLKEKICNYGMNHHCLRRQRHYFATWLKFFISSLIWSSKKYGTLFIERATSLMSWWVLHVTYVAGCINQAVCCMLLLVSLKFHQY